MDPQDDSTDSLRAAPQGDNAADGFWMAPSKDDSPGEFRAAPQGDNHGAELRAAPSKDDSADGLRTELLSDDHGAGPRPVPLSDDPAARLRSTPPHDAYIARLRMPALSGAAGRAARQRWDSLAKPFGSLGLFEDAVTRIAALTGDADVDISRRCLVVACADNGVVAEGVSPSGQEVTATMARCIARGESSVARMCAQAHIDRLVVDMGMVVPLPNEDIRDCRIAAGTGSIATGPAMSRDQALAAIRCGVELVGELRDQGYRLIATGEMGIGNTTTSTALACALTGRDPEGICGRGAGLDDEGLARKVAVLRRALAANRPDPLDPIDCLAKLGGFDLAALCGLFLGGAVHGVPIVVDGLISTAAAFCAWRLRPECASAMLASHISAEPTAALLLELMGLRAPIHAELRLGEGTGATCLVPLLDLALAVYHGAATLSELEIVSYAKVDDTLGREVSKTEATTRATDETRR